MKLGATERSFFTGAGVAVSVASKERLVPVTFWVDWVFMLFWVVWVSGKFGNTTVDMRVFFVKILIFL
jgi:hypothetical protein